jgi:WD40 repeat protein
MSSPRYPRPAVPLLARCLILLALLCCGTTAVGQDRYVPQHGLTDLDPWKIDFHPTDGTRLLVVNQSGRIDLFDIANPDRPVKTAEIFAGAEDAAFDPAADRIVSGGSDGTVRLWTLDGQPAAAPFQGHEGWVLSVAFSSSGDRVVSTGGDGTVRLWTLDGRAATAPFRGHEGKVYDVSINPSGDRIVSAGRDGTVRLWTLDGQPAAAPFRGHEGRVRSVAFNPGGDRIVSAGHDGTVRLWMLDGQPAAAPFRGHPGEVLSVAFSPSGDRIVSAGDAQGTVRLWTLDGQSAVAPFPGLSGLVFSVAFSPSGDRIASAGADGTVRLWALDGERAAVPFRGHEGVVSSVAFSPSGNRFVSGGSDGTVRLWTLDGQAAAGPFQAHGDFVRSVAFNSSGDRIVSGGSDGTVRLWTLDGQPGAEPFRGHEDDVNSAAFSPSGDRIVSGGSDGTVRIWTLDGQPAAAPFEGHRGSVYSVSFNPGGDRIVSAGRDGTVRLWTLDGQPAAAPFRGHDGYVQSVAFSPNGDRIASAGRDGTVRLWALDGQPVGAPFRGHKGNLLSVAFNPIGDRIISAGYDGSLRLWTLDGQPAAAPIRGHKTWVWSVAFNPSGDRIVSASADGTVRLWTLEARPVAEPLRGNRSGVGSATLNQHGDRIVSAGTDGTLTVWSLNGKSAAEPFPGHQGWVWSVAFSPRGDRIASAGNDGTVRLWTLDGQAAAEPFRGHEGVIHSVSFNPSGDRVVSGGTDRSVRLWTLDGQPATGPFRGHKGVVYSVAFNPSGDRIISAGGDGSVRLWTLDGQQSPAPVKSTVDAVRGAAYSPSGDRIVYAGGDGTVRVSDRAGKPGRIVFRCPAHHVQPVAGDHWTVWCEDRIAVLDASLELVGSLFPHKEGLVAITSDGAWATSNELHQQVRAFGEDGTLLTRVGAVPSLTATELRQQLWDDYTPWERFQRWAVATWQQANSYYDQLGWLKAPFWPALGWTLVALSALSLWLLAPARLAAWAMPRTGAPPPPPWKWLLGVLTLYGWLGVTRRPLRAWLRRHRESLSRAAFLERDAVRERERYCPLGHDTAMDNFVAALHRRALCWIDGSGGSGKSALAFQLARDRLIPDRRAPLPVLVDADWDGPLAAEVGRLLRVDTDPGRPERQPTETMARSLGAMGLVCPIVDSLSERSGDSVARVSAAVREGSFRHLIVTSRQDPPQGLPWEHQPRIQPQPVGRDDLVLFISTYASDLPQVSPDGDGAGADRSGPDPDGPAWDRAEIARRIAPLIAEDPLPSPLFLRFAIEQAAAGPLAATGRLDLVLDYLEALRAGRVDLNRSDLVRAGSVAALEACRADGVPREIDRLHLRGVLQAETDRMPLLDAANARAVEPAAIIDRLVACGLLNPAGRGHRLQFAYDPVAELLAAHWLREHPELPTLREGLLGCENPVAAAYAEIASGHREGGVE